MQYVYMCKCAYAYTYVCIRAYTCVRTHTYSLSKHCGYLRSLVNLCTLSDLQSIVFDAVVLGIQHLITPLSDCNSAKKWGENSRGGCFAK